MIERYEYWAEGYNGVKERSLKATAVRNSVRDHYMQPLEGSRIEGSCIFNHGEGPNYDQTTEIKDFVASVPLYDPVHWCKTTRLGLGYTDAELEKAEDPFSLT